MDTMHTRRTFLTRGLTVLSAATTMPLFIQRTCLALNNPHDLPLTQTAMGIGEQILVCVQMSGGNDGLSTVIPLDNDDYHRARPTLGAIPNPLALDKSGVALHPGLAGLKEIYDGGHLAVIQGVGYPNPNRSHFRSMEIWQTADPMHPPKDGWLGRYFDAQCKGSDPKDMPDPKAAVNIGATAPLALQGSKFTAISFQNPQSYQWFAGNKGVDAKMRNTFAQVNDLNDTGDELAGQSSGNPTLDFLERTALDAQLTSDEIRAVTSKYHPAVSYPNTPFGQQLQMVSQMIAGGLKTRVYYVSLGGFDTHSNEKPAHDRLMQTLAAGINAFMRDLKSQGNDQKVLVMTFSEFGRRVAENASKGTDHGTAAPMFVCGSMVKGGVYGAHPSLRPQDLDAGDLKFHTDFRSVYATLLGDWMKADSAPILGGNFRTLPLLA
ncbi:MAG TPA: DUF1501 domain-containing protein [Phycisphaerae bacterium]|nr:DUF1501 domain-containing protein [Phycisphaerae bacterium]